MWFFNPKFFFKIKLGLFIIPTLIIFVYKKNKWDENFIDAHFLNFYFLL